MEPIQTRAHAITRDPQNHRKFTVKDRAGNAIVVFADELDDLARSLDKALEIVETEAR